MNMVMSRTTEAPSKGKIVWKVASYILALLGRPPLEMSVDLAEGLIEGACEYKVLLAKQFSDNWNQGYQ